MFPKIIFRLNEFMAECIRFEPKKIKTYSALFILLTLVLIPAFSLTSEQDKLARVLSQMSDRAREVIPNGDSEEFLKDLHAVLDE